MSTIKRLLSGLFKSRSSEDDLNNPRRFPWTGEETVIDFIAANSYTHYREHADQIQAWLARDTMQA